MGTPTVAQEALVLNSFAAILQNELVSRDIVKFNEHAGELDDRNGLVVTEQFAPRYVVTQTTDGVKDVSSGTDNSVFGSEQFKVNSTFNANMGWGDFQKIRDVGDARESEALKGAATCMAEKIDAYILQVAGLASNNWIGTPANSIDDSDELMSAYTRLKEEGVSDADLYAVMNFTDKQGLGDQVLNLPAPGEEASKALRIGFRGEVGGINTLFTQQLHTLTLGNDVSGVTVDGASQNVNYDDVAVSAAPGQYMTQTIALTGFTANTGTLVAGSVFTIAGVNAYDNRKGASLGRLQQFTVVTGGTADANGDIVARIFPAIIVPASGSGGDVNVNSAHATVTAAPADTAAVTFVGSASTAYTPRLLLQKGAIVVNTIPLIMPATGQAMRRKLDKVPISVRMWKNSDFGTGAHDVRFDVALTANVRDRRRVCRFNGV